jgi:hypothetical protein
MATAYQDHPAKAFYIVLMLCVHQRRRNFYLYGTQGDDKIFLFP